MDESGGSGFISNAKEKFSGKQVISDLQWLIFECSERCITDTVIWASEVVTYCSKQWFEDYEECEDELLVPENPYVVSQLTRHVALGRSLLLAQDHYRAIFHFEKIKKLNRTTTFLYYWSRYLAAARVSLENDAESVERKAAEVSRGDQEEMSALHSDLLREKAFEVEKYAKEQNVKKIDELDNRSIVTDIFLEFLIARVELSLGLVSIALDRFTQCAKKEPRFWPAFQCLVPHIHTEKQIENVLGKKGTERVSFVQDWFECVSLVSLQNHRASIECAEQLVERGLGGQPMILAHVAATKNAIYENETALVVFGTLQKIEPFRIEKMELYAEALFVTGNRMKLADLAHRLFRTHKFKWETCLIVANYYAMRADHETAIRFMQRALKLNPFSARTWTLIGHEFMELKNNPAATMAYRKSIEIDPHDHSGYYGLGCMYDILKMPTYALHYYQQAHKCRPQDSRMLVALGEVYARINGKSDEAARCFIKAFRVGDVEGSALLGLAKVYESDRQSDNAAATYEKYLSVYADMANDDTNFPSCLLFLAKYYLRKDNLDAACAYAQKCLEYDVLHDESASVLRQVNDIRAAKPETSTLDLDATVGSSMDMVSEGDPDESY